MTLSRLAELSADPTASFVLIARDGADTVELLSGEVVDVDLLADIPLTIDGTPREVFSMVPYRQVRERGFVVSGMYPVSLGSLQAIEMDGLLVRTRPMENQLTDYGAVLNRRTPS